MVLSPTVPKIPLEKETIRLAEAQGAAADLERFAIEWHAKGHDLFTRAKKDEALRWEVASNLATTLGEMVNRDIFPEPKQIERVAAILLQRATQLATTHSYLLTLGSEHGITGEAVVDLAQYLNGCRS